MDVLSDFMLGMLVLSVLASVFLVLCTTIFVSAPKNSLKATLLLGGLLTLGQIPCGLLIFPALWIQVPFLVLLVAIWQRRGYSSRSYAPAAILVSLAAYAVPAWFLVQQLRERDELKRAFAFESLVSRLATPKTEWRPDSLSGEVNNGLALLEDRDLNRIDRAAMEHRNRELWQLHNGHVNEFIRLPGFGVQRTWNAEQLLAWSKALNRGPIAQPGLSFARNWMTGSERAPDLMRAEASLQWHSEMVRLFAQMVGFGLFESRDKVAGFVPHQFQTRLENPAPWLVQRVELVSLLLHDQPVVYVSDSLPRMLDVDKIQTRPIELFEIEGLESLRKGEDLYARQKGNEIRMLGGIRAAKQCVDCHAAQRGDLLGAFSYSLVHKKEESPKDKSSGPGENR